MYKLTDDATLTSGVLRDESFQLVPTKDLPGLSLALFVKKAQRSPAKWASELVELVADRSELSGLTTMSSGAVLLVHQESATYALTFGTGFQALKPAKVVTGFGLKVAANSIARAKIKSADTRMLSTAGRSQKTILPEASELTALGIEPLEEWVRQLSGNVADTAFAKTASGSDSLRLTIEKFSLHGLPKKLTEVKSLYEATDYKSQFGFIDNFKQLDPQKDKSRILLLDLDVLDRIRARDPSIFFAAPEPFELYDVATYALVHFKKRTIDDLTQTDVYAALGDLDLTSDEVLTQIDVRPLDEDGKPAGKPCDLRNCIQAEVVDGDDRFILSCGRWFKVAKDYIEQVAEYLATIDDITDQLQLPSWKKDDEGTYEDEGAYNIRVATDLGLARLDKDDLSFGGHQKIEICDLLTSNKMLICVKRATRSSTLSHLFAQGSVSASLMYHDKYRSKLLDALESLGEDRAWGGTESWTIVYAIATEKTGELLEDLFFFSRMNLMTHVQDIRSRSIKVAVARISIT